MSVTTFVPIGVGTTGEHLVQAMPYIPGEEIFIHETLTNAYSVFYTVPDNMRLFISYIGLSFSVADGYSFISILNNTNQEVLRLLENYRVNLSGGVSTFINFWPMLELSPGYKLKGYSADTGNTRIFDVNGYLLSTYGGY